MRVAPGHTAAAFTRIAVEPVGATVGAVVTGVDLRQPIDDAQFHELDAALAEHKVLLFHDQYLTLAQHASFAARWGPLVDDHLIPSQRPDPVDNVVVFTRDADQVGLENEWHTDGTFRTVPTMGTVLRAIEVPDIGGDTIFADMAAAYDNLPDELKARVEPLRAVHDWSLGAYAGKYGDHLDEYRARVPPVAHPIVLRHPRTGRSTLFVNRLFTSHIEGLEPAESDALLDLLCRQAEVPEYHCRVRWRPGTIAFWDNVAVQHYGVNDYYPSRRVMARASIASV
ncbi:MAG TPA: TauD/TfdA family dioxygenase [Acidimicrobiales bacterium]|nr:TauD/TfdA family dioxygenase [Acidimicrobiales bacterium]